MTQSTKQPSVELLEKEAIIERKRDDINEGFAIVGEQFHLIREHELFKYGYGTFYEYIEDRWDMSRQNADRMIDGYETLRAIREKTGVGQTPSLRALRPLFTMALEERAEVFEKAQHLAGTKPVTGKIVEATVAEHKASTPAAPPGAVETVGGAAPAPAKSGGTKKKKEKPGVHSLDDEKLVDAVERIADICEVKTLRNALLKGTIPLLRKEILAWAGEKPATIRDAEKLITVQRWPVKKAIAFLDRKPTGKTRLEDLMNLAVANGIAAEIHVNQFVTFVLTPAAAKEHSAKIAKMLKLD